MLDFTRSSWNGHTSGDSALTRWTLTFARACGMILMLFTEASVAIFVSITDAARVEDVGLDVVPASASINACAPHRVYSCSPSAIGIGHRSRIRGVPRDAVGLHGLLEPEHIEIVNPLGH